MKMRPLRVSDFYNKNTVSAVYYGNSRYLNKEWTYEVSLTKDPNLVTVKLTDNPNLKYSNGGVRFTISTFRVKEDESMINFDDLSPEDKERVLAQARQMVDDENIKRNAATVYSMKKKDLLEENVKEICNVYKYKYNPEQKQVRQHYVSMTNFLYKIYTRTKCTIPIPGIIDNEGWVAYQQIANEVKNMMISAYKLRGEL